MWKHSSNRNWKKTSVQGMFYFVLKPFGFKIKIVSYTNKIQNKLKSRKFKMPLIPRKSKIFWKWYICILYISIKSYKKYLIKNLMVIFELTTIYKYKKKCWKTTIGFLSPSIKTNFLPKIICKFWIINHFYCHKKIKKSLIIAVKPIYIHRFATR